jgi:hypothetical protein
MRVNNGLRMTIRGVIVSTLRLAVPSRRTADSVSAMIILGDVIQVYRCLVLHYRSWEAISGSLLLAVSGIALVISIYPKRHPPPANSFRALTRRYKLQRGLPRLDWYQSLDLSCVLLHPGRNITDTDEMETAGLILWKIRQEQRAEKADSAFSSTLEKCPIAIDSS